MRVTAHARKRTGRLLQCKYKSHTLNQTQGHVRFLLAVPDEATDCEQPHLSLTDRLLLVQTQVSTLSCCTSISQPLIFFFWLQNNLHVKPKISNSKLSTADANPFLRGQESHYAHLMGAGYRPGSVVFFDFPGLHSSYRREKRRVLKYFICTKQTGKLLAPSTVSNGSVNQ